MADRRPVPERQREAQLRDARTAAKNDRRFERNVAALEAAQLWRRRTRRRSTRAWASTGQGSDYARFRRRSRASALTCSGTTRRGSGRSTSSAATRPRRPPWTGYGAPARRRDPEIALTGRPIRITDTVDAGGGGSKKTVFNPTATEAANAALTKMREEFTRWV